MASRPEHVSGRIYIPRWVQLAVLPALLIIGWFVLGAIGQVIFIFQETWLFFRPRLQFEGWCAAVTGAVSAGGQAPAGPGAGARGRLTPGRLTASRTRRLPGPARASTVSSRAPSGQA